MPDTHDVNENANVLGRVEVKHAALALPGTFTCRCADLYANLPYTHHWPAGVIMYLW